MGLPIDPASAVLVVGSQAWNPADRSLGREHIRSVWIVTGDGPVHCPWFDPIGPNGVRDLLPFDDGRVVVSNGYDLSALDPETGALTSWPLDGVSDLHEVRLAGDRVLVANTQRDELIELDLTGVLTRRRDLGRFRHRKAQPITHDRRLGGALGGEANVHADHFHLNQGFVGADGHTWVLVHHTAGYRPLTHVRQRLTGHGSGGVIDLDADTVVPLGLRAPHSVRPYSDGAVILDSGRSEVVRYDAGWNELGRHPTGGWGRGAALDPSGRHLYVGLSATRARYLEPGADPGVNRVVAIDTDTWAPAGDVAIDGVEQLWSVSIIDPVLAENLVALRRPEPGSGADGAHR